jgi:hypothetical protein
MPNLTVEGAPSGIAVRGNITELPDGTLLMPYYGALKQGQLSSCGLLRSTDRGENWTPYSIMAFDPDCKKNFVEANIYRTESGRIVGLFRTQSDYQAAKRAGIPFDATYLNLHISVSEDDGKTYKHSKFVPGVRKRGKGVRLIQPTLWEDATGVHMLIRSNAGKIYKSDSTDFGLTWCKAYETPYPNPNSGIDLIKLEDETIVLCMNPVGADWGNRAPLVLMRSFDGGNTFEEFFKLEAIKGDYEFSYPAITAVGKTLHITYTNERKTIIYWQVEIE